MTSDFPHPAELATRLCAGERRAIARALNLLDDRRPAAREAAHRLLCALPGERVLRSGHLVGLTGPPGAGKSSLAAALLRLWRVQGLRVGVLAVDPSSPRSGGALLGDRLRMLQPQPDDGLFIRSLATRLQPGGVSAEVWPMSQVLLCACEIVLVETVGVGQIELDVAGLTDTTCLVVQPASGDTIQFMKAGILELPHVLAVNKADLGAVALQAAHELRRTLTPGSGGSAADWVPPVLLTSATGGEGLEALAAALAAHREHLAGGGRLEAGRRRHLAAWAVRQLREEFGRHGLEHLGGERCLLELWPAAADLSAPLEHLRGLRETLLDRFDG